MNAHQFNFFYVAYSVTEKPSINSATQCYEEYDSKVLRELGDGILCSGSKKDFFSKMAFEHRLECLRRK